MSGFTGSAFRCRPYGPGIFRPTGVDVKVVTLWPNDLNGFCMTVMLQLRKEMVNAADRIL